MANRMLDAMTDHEETRRSNGLASRLVVGSLGGLAWATGLRGFMSEIAGGASNVDWLGTFGWILLPGVIAGGLLGWADHLRRTGGRPGWRWLALSPLLLSSALLTGPDEIMSMLEDGIGFGALTVPLFGIAGGYALSRRGPAWARGASAVLALSPIPAWAMIAVLVGGPGLALDTPRGAWVALYYYSFLGVLSLASAIPHLPVTLPRQE